MKAGNKNRCCYGLLCSHWVAKSLVYTKWLYVGMHLGTLRIHKMEQKEPNKEYMEHMQRINKELNFVCSLSRAIPSLDFSTLLYFYTSYVPRITIALDTFMTILDKKEPAKKLNRTYDSSVFTSYHHLHDLVKSFSVKPGDGVPTFLLGL